MPRRLTSNTRLYSDAASGRSGPLVTLDCSALAPDDLAAALFGTDARSSAPVSRCNGSASARAQGGTRGSHGYDPALTDMRAMFIAHGPAFRHGLTLDGFDNVDVYPLLAHLLECAQFVVHALQRGAGLGQRTLGADALFEGDRERLRVALSDLDDELRTTHQLVAADRSSSSRRAPPADTRRAREGSLNDLTGC